MDEQALLHRISVETDVNIELLKDLLHNENLLALIKAGRSIDAIVLIRKTQPSLGLREAKMIADALSTEL